MFQLEIRHVRQSDSQSILSLFSCLDQETAFMLFEPNERETTLEQQRTILETFEQDASRLFLVAVEDAEIMGFLGITHSPRIRQRHLGSLVMGVKKVVWGRGIGGKLLQQAIDWADQNGTHKLELSVHTTNRRAVALYERFGFAIEGERIHSIRLKDRWCNEYHMGRLRPS